MRKLILIIGLFIRDLNLLKALLFIKKAKKFTKEEMVKYQEEKLRKLINHSYNNVPYYQNLFDTYNIKPTDIKTISDLQKIPILTKDLVKENFNELQSRSTKGFRIKYGMTGGSTGKPLTYRTTSLDTSLSLALLLNGYSQSNYKLGDHVVVVGGSSVVKQKDNFQKRIKHFFTDFILNQKAYSTLQTNEAVFKKIIKHINKRRVVYLRGYKSSIYLLAEYIENNSIDINCDIKGVFTTAEKLLPAQRKFIEKVFNSKVYNQYSLNDGGVSAFENKEGKLLIDFERAIFEIIDDNNINEYGREGKIIATQLFNYAMPFIRYDSEDLGIMTYNPNGKDYLEELVGKSNDIIKVGGNYNITPLLNKILKEFDIENYQVIREKKILKVFISTKNKRISYKLHNILKENIPGIPIEINAVNSDYFKLHSNGKHKFIINKTEE